MHRIKSRGQAAIEYVMLVALMTGIFGFFYGVIRQQLYKLWVCELGPRVQSPAGCAKDTNDCFQTIQDNAPGLFQPPPGCN